MKALIQEYLEDINYLIPGTIDIVDVAEYRGYVEVWIRHPYIQGHCDIITITTLELLCWLKGHGYD